MTIRETVGFIVGGLLALAVMGMFGLPSTEAHDEETYYPDKSWPVDPTVRFGNLESALDGTSTARIETNARLSNAKNQWNGVSGSTWDVGYSQGFYSSVIWTGSVCTTATWGNITIVTHQISSIADANWCATSTTITRSVIRLDYRSWDNDGGATPPSEWDLEGVLVHELGHTSGFGLSSTLHFSGSTTCPTPSTYHSMCAAYSMGFENWRSLETHDKHTIANFY